MIKNKLDLTHHKGHNLKIIFMYYEIKFYLLRDFTIIARF